ncbi:hypothetical protein, partial [Mycobacterium kansasii]
EATLQASERAAHAVVTPAAAAQQGGAAAVAGAAPLAGPAAVSAARNTGPRWRAPQPGLRQ